MFHPLSTGCCVAEYADGFSLQAGCLLFITSVYWQLVTLSPHRGNSSSLNPCVDGDTFPAAAQPCHGAHHTAWEHHPSTGRSTEGPPPERRQLLMA